MLNAINPIDGPKKAEMITRLRAELKLSSIAFEKRFDSSGRARRILLSGNKICFPPILLLKLLVCPGFLLRVFLVYAQKLGQIVLGRELRQES